MQTLLNDNNILHREKNTVKLHLVSSGEGSSGPVTLAGALSIADTEALTGILGVKI